MHFRRPKVERMVNNINNIRLKLNNKSKVYYFENMMIMIKLIKQKKRPDENSFN